MRLKIDSETCTGHGRCYVLHPELFDADEEGFGMVRNDTDVIQALAQAVTLDCPERAITVLAGADELEEEIR